MESFLNVQGLSKTDFNDFTEHGKQVMRKACTPAMPLCPQPIMTLGTSLLPADEAVSFSLPWITSSSVWQLQTHLITN